MLEIERESRSHSVENSLWKGLWTCRKVDSAMIYISSFVCVCVCVNSLHIADGAD
jgi:hypothetical protein